MSAAGVAFALLAAASARRVADVVALVAGILLLLVSGLHLMPEAVGEGGSALLFLLMGAGVGVLLELVVETQKSAATGVVLRSASVLGLLVLALHSTLDGAVYTAAFWHGSDSGVLASLGLILHEAPEGMVAMMLALQSGLRPVGAATVGVLASSLTTPIGWALARRLEAADVGVMQAMFAASAGLLLFVGGHLAISGWRSLRRGAGPHA